MAFLSLFLIALGGCALCTGGAIRLAFRLRIFDVPDDRKIHADAIPYLGGVGIFGGLIIALAFLPWIHDTFLFEDVRFLKWIIVGSAIVVAFGVWDDVCGSGALPKLVMQTIVALMMYYAGVNIERLSIPGVGAYTLGWLSPIVSILWFMLLMNSMNLIDGLDGLAAGISGIGALFVFCFGLAYGGGITTWLAIIIVGICSGFLIFNFHPAKVFMGDAGSLLLGFLLAVVTMLSRTKSPTLIVLLVPIIALGIPVFDSLFAFARRALTGKHPFRADRRHLHHRLMGLGLSHKRVVLALYYISLYLGVMAFILSSTNQWIILLTAVLLGSGVVLFIEYVSYLEGHDVDEHGMDDRS